MSLKTGNSFITLRAPQPKTLFASLKAHQDMRRAAFKQVQEQDIKAAQKSFEASERQKDIGYALALKNEGFFDLEVIPQLLQAPPLKMGGLLEGIEEVARRYQYMDASQGSVADYEFARQVGYTPDLNEKHLQTLDTHGLINRWVNFQKGGGSVRYFRLTTRGQVAIEVYRETSVDHTQAEKAKAPSNEIPKK
jgi:hypothetical protein